MASEPTADEIRRVSEFLVRRSCAEDGHQPSKKTATFGDLVGHFRCDCGQVRWVPEHKPRL